MIIAHSDSSQLQANQPYALCKIITFNVKTLRNNQTQLPERKPKVLKSENVSIKPTPKTATQSNLNPPEQPRMNTPNPRSTQNLKPTREFKGANYPPRNSHPHRIHREKRKIRVEGEGSTKHRWSALHGGPERRRRTTKFKGAKAESETDEAAATARGGDPRAT